MGCFRLRGLSHCSPMLTGLASMGRVSSFSGHFTLGVTFLKGYWDCWAVRREKTAGTECWGLVPKLQVTAVPGAVRGFRPWESGLGSL